MMSTNTTKFNHMEDRLSNLPNEILTKILSCIKTKEAVRTGILSTRWKSVWSSVPTLDLCHSDFGSYGDGAKVEARFLTFMNRVLLARKLPSFEKIRIHGQTCDPYLIISWMRAALERNVSELHVHFSRFSIDPPCELTHNLFSYNKLVVLKLCVDMTLYLLANSSCFPNLKVLELKGILYKDDDSLPNLLSSCPILEDLVIIRSTWDNLVTLNLTSRSLKRLKVDSYFEDSDERVDVLTMVIDAPSVESLDISCETTKKYVVKDLSSIVEAELDIFNAPIMSDTYNCYKFLREISNVKILRLEPCTVQALMLTDSYNLPMFHNLTRLEIYGDDSPHLYEKFLLQWKLMLEILKCSPMLETLIYEEFAIPPQEHGEAPDWDVPNCLVSRLKTVEIDSNSEYDVEKARYFLINAQVLEKMIIRSCYSKKIFNNICDVISKNPKISVTRSEKEIIISFL